jgi:outer membrane lipoprotein LolB
MDVLSLPPRSGNYLVYLCFFLLPLAGCSSLPRTGPAEGGFHLRGKMGIVQGEESFSARFLWQQQGERFTMDLWGPLGQGRVRLSGDGRHLELREGDGTLISRGAPDEVMMRHLGWSLPLSVLPQWVRGQPARGIPVHDRMRDAAGRLSGFHQLDWQVELDGYRPVEDGAGSAEAIEPGAPGGQVFLPHRVTARREAYRVRLAISAWQL